MAKPKNTRRSSKELPTTETPSLPGKGRKAQESFLAKKKQISQGKEFIFKEKEEVEEIGLQADSIEDSIAAYELLETLLDIEDRAPLPPAPQSNGPGPKSKLAALIRFAPDRYASMIARIRAGASFHVAAEAVGIAERTFFSWAQIGAQDLSEAEPKDTYYSRFFKDIRRAAAQATASCEETVMTTSPAKWLTHGPGRIFNTTWSREAAPQSPQREALPDPNIVDAAFHVTHEVKAIAANPQEGYLEIDASAEYEALKIWEDLGCITLSPEMKKAFDQQNAVEQEP